MGHVDTPKLLIRFNASSKVKTTKEEGVEMRSLVCNTLGIRKACLSSGIGTKKNDKWVNYSHGPTQTKQQFG
jgi:hypothetical protein